MYDVASTPTRITFAEAITSVSFTKSSGNSTRNVSMESVVTILMLKKSVGIVGIVGVTGGMQTRLEHVLPAKGQSISSRHSTHPTR